MNIFMHVPKVDSRKCQNTTRILRRRVWHFVKLRKEGHLTRFVEKQNFLNSPLELNPFPYDPLYDNIVHTQFYTKLQEEQVKNGSKAKKVDEKKG